MQLPTADQYIGRMFKREPGSGHPETITITDVTLEGGQARIHVRYNDGEHSYAYSMEEFGKSLARWRRSPSRRRRSDRAHTGQAAQAPGARGSPATRANARGILSGRP
ncbi:hypothetical protein SAMN02990966_05929 [Rhodospirillales bacterium URHD0017]|nr:hypothetical protein SAMN02990966_05929 [Rhodospirillales bacterium URHD0017]